MRKEPNQKQIIILSILAALVYVFIMLEYFYSDIESVRAGYDGEEFRIIENEQTFDESQSLTYPIVYFLKVKPLKGYRHYPDQVQNLKSDTNYPARFSNIEIALPETKKLTDRVNFLNALNAAVVLFMIMLYFITSFTFILLIRSLYKGWVFHSKNIKRTRKLGYLLIMIYLSGIISNYISYKIHDEIFSFQDYKLVFQFTQNYLLMMGLSILLMAEILARGLKLKEEQDLII